MMIFNAVVLISLGKSCLNEFGKELVLILYNKVPWNSMSKMISRFLEIESAIRKTEHFNEQEMPPTDNEV